MPHGDLAQVAAVVGALGSVLVLLARGRAPMLGGFAVLAAAEVMLALALIPRSDLARLLHRPLLLAGVVLIVLAGLALTVVLVWWPVLTPLALLVAAPFRIPVNLGSQHAFLLLPLYFVLGAAALAFCWGVVRRPTRGVTWTIAVPVAVFIG